MASIQIFKPFRPLALMDVAQEAPGLIAITPATWAARHAGHWPDAHLHYNEEAWNEKVGLRPQGDVLAPIQRNGVKAIVAISLQRGYPGAGRAQYRHHRRHPVRRVRMVAL